MLITEHSCLHTLILEQKQFMHPQIGRTDNQTSELTPCLSLKIFREHKLLDFLVFIKDQTLMKI
jgi:hypothetical protein